MLTKVQIATLVLGAILVVPSIAFFFLVSFLQKRSITVNDFKNSYTPDWVLWDIWKDISYRSKRRLTFSFSITIMLALATLFTWGQVYSKLTFIIFCAYAILTTVLWRTYSHDKNTAHHAAAQAYLEGKGRGR